MPRPRRIKSVFLNIPYDAAFESLYLAYLVGLTLLGLRINATLAVPKQGRLETIINPIEHSDVSVHDLSRIEASRGVPRFNMPVELGLALYRSHVAKEKHGVFIFESRRYRAQRSIPQIRKAERRQWYRCTDSRRHAKRADGGVAEHLSSSR